MNRLAPLWATFEREPRRVRLIALGAVLVGVLFIVGGEIAHAGWTRIVGALLITIFGSVFGASVGFAAPLRAGIAARLDALRRPIIIVSAVVFALPAVVALLAGLPGLAANDLGDAALTALGTALLLIFAVATVVAVAIAMQAAWRANEAPQALPEGAEDPGTGEGQARS